ncbi:unnamed protein product [Soboliphyme baturini]|uniref:histone deacetylase n=1 Tax=Soboliphyme baturini TaxID=241478 RepID=A0A183J7Y0_9BILA|nr:unnamed protein product [Soboliphyme baturini]
MRFLISAAPFLKRSRLAECRYGSWPPADSSYASTFFAQNFFDFAWLRSTSPIVICEKDASVQLSEHFVLIAELAFQIAIVDWDVHHGNGTQMMFEAESNVLYLSLHRYDDGSFFPGTGAVSEVGKGAGSGFTVNIAWSGETMGDAEYLAAWRSVVMHVLKQFEPDIVLVSAGFDGARGHCSALGGYHLSTEMFAYMTEKLTELCSRLVLVLEGGYELEVCNKAAEKCLRVLAEKAHFDLPEESVKAIPNRSARETLRKVVSVHEKYWSNLSDDGIAMSHEVWEKLHMKMEEDCSDESFCVVDVVNTNSPKQEALTDAGGGGAKSSVE